MAPTWKHRYPIADAMDRITASRRGHQAVETARPQDVAGTEAPHVKEIVRKVYVTGYGPFRNIVDNPSSLITSSLLPTTTIITYITSTTILKIHIIPHPNALRVAYANIDIDVAGIYATQDFDYIIHLGVGLNGGYKLETIAWGDGYVRGDVDGLVPGGGKAIDETSLKRVGLLKPWGGEWVVNTIGREEGGWLGTGVDVQWICEMVGRGRVEFEVGWGGEKKVVLHEEEDGEVDKEQSGDQISEEGNATQVQRPPASNPAQPPPPPPPPSHRKLHQKGYIINPSTNAGRFACEYIFRRSLERAIALRSEPESRKPWNWRKRAQRSGEGSNDNDNDSQATEAAEPEAENISKRVLFMHVPNTGQPYSIEDGVKALEQVVVAMVVDAEGFRKRKNGATAAVGA